MPYAKVGVLCLRTPTTNGFPLQGYPHTHNQNDLLLSTIEICTSLHPSHLLRQFVCVKFCAVDIVAYGWQRL